MAHLSERFRVRAFLAYGLAGLWLAAGAAPLPDAAEARATLDRQTVSATDQLLAALSKWERGAVAERASGAGQLAQLAQRRQEYLIRLLQADPAAARTRLMPNALRARMPASAQAYVEQKVRVQGTAMAEITDDFAGHHSTSTLKVKVTDQTVLTVVAADPKSDGREFTRMAGRKVTLEAIRVGNYLTVSDASQVQLEALGSTSVTTSASTGTVTGSATTIQGDRKTLIILTNFTDKPVSCTAADVSARVFGASGSTTNVQYQQSSRGLVSFSGQTIGPYNIPYSSTGTCDFNSWGTAAEAAAKAAGIDTTQYQHISYVTPPNASCGWAGLGEMPGTHSWVQACGATGVFSHEFGHNLLMNHASTPTDEYGDLSDSMGGGDVVQSNAPNHAMAGWAATGAGGVVDVTTGGSYAVSPLELSAPSSPQMLRIAKPDTNEYYFLSLRQPIGVDTSIWSSFQNTLSVHRSVGAMPSRTYLLQTLAAGQTFTDSVNGIAITMQGVSGQTATVSVGFGSGGCSRSAPSVAITPASQTGGAGSSLAYTVSVTNRNSSGCGPSAFGIGQSLPSGMTGTLSAASATLAPGSSASATWTVTSAATLPDATYTLSASASDAATGSAASAYASDIVYTDGTVTCVRAAPLVSVNPPTQSGAPGSMLQYAVSVANRNSAACGTSVFSLGQTLPAGLSGSLGSQSLSIAPGASASIGWSVGSAANSIGGSYAIAAGAAEASGSAASGVATDVVVAAADTTAPTVSITAPSAGGKLSGTRVTITASASDASGIAAVEFYVDGTLLARDTSTPYSANWSLRKVSAGSHVIVVRATDNAGNIGQQSISVTK